MGKLSNNKIVIIAITAIIIVLVVGLSIYFVLFHKTKGSEGKTQEVLLDEKYEEIKNNFNAMFTNTVRRSFSQSTEPTKVDNTKEIVYTKNEVNVQADNKYDINVNLPCINIVGTEAQSINNEIDRLFGDKVNSAIQSPDIETIYNVDYVAYLNDDMLSLVIRATLKENDMPQRMIVKTYNYNFSRQGQVNLGNLIVRNRLDKDDVQDKIYEEIEKIIKTNEALEANGYTVHKRYLSNNRYMLGNIDTYYIDQNDYLYIIFAYGNQNYTNEFDVVVF